MGSTVRWLLVSALTLGAATNIDGGEERSDGCSAQHLKIWVKHWTGELESSWTLAADGSAEVKSGMEKHRLQLSTDECLGLVRVLESERFFALEEFYGAGVIDGAIREFRISLGDKRQNVVLYQDLASDPRRGSIKRALRVWIAVRSLFDVPGAADSRAEDRAFLER